MFSKFHIIVAVLFEGYFDLTLHAVVLILNISSDIFVSELLKFKIYALYGCFVMLLWRIFIISRPPRALFVKDCQVTLVSPEALGAGDFLLSFYVGKFEADERTNEKFVVDIIFHLLERSKLADSCDIVEETQLLGSWSNV